METEPGIVILDRKIDPQDLARLVGLHFEGMVKYVVDIEKRIGKGEPLE
jgi:hypothetical protein